MFGPFSFLCMIQNIQFRIYCISYLEHFPTQGEITYHKLHKREYSCPGLQSIYLIKSNRDERSHLKINVMTMSLTDLKCSYIENVY